MAIERGSKELNGAAKETLLLADRTVPTARVRSFLFMIRFLVWSRFEAWIVILTLSI